MPESDKMDSRLSSADLPLYTYGLRHYAHTQLYATNQSATAGAKAFLAQPRATTRIGAKLEHLEPAVFQPFNPNEPHTQAAPIHTSRTMALAPSSPRLPSPPPPAEIQIGPNSPSGGAAADPATTQMEQNLVDSNARRRIHPGTKASDMAAGPPLVPLGEVSAASEGAARARLSDGQTNAGMGEKTTN